MLKKLLTKSFIFITLFNSLIRYGHFSVATKQLIKNQSKINPILIAINQSD